MNKQDLLPHQVVVDLVLLYSAFMPKLGQAAVLQNNLLIAAKNHRGEFVSLSMPIHFDGDPFEGASKAPPRFVLRKIDSTVWKLSPSILHDKLHAYVTIVDVPENVSWGEERISAAETAMTTIDDVRTLSRDARQKRVANWAREAFGEAEATGLAQRGVRLLEEAIEAFQACGGDEEIAHKLVAFVFARPAGTVGQELGGVSVTVLALAAAAGLSADEEIDLCASGHRFWREGPYVSALPSPPDSELIVAMKGENNGDTYIWSKYALPWLDDDACYIWTPPKRPAKEAR